MKSVQKESGKHGKKDSKPRTENHKTHDVKPRTEDTEHATITPCGPVLFLYILKKNRTNKIL